MCYPGTDVLLLGFSLVNPDTFNNVKSVWLAETKRPGLKGVPVGEDRLQIGASCYNLSNKVKSLF